MSNSNTEADIFFAEFNGRRYAYGFSADEVRTTIESSFRFGDPSKEGALSETWAGSDAQTGWRIVKHNHPVVHLTVKYVGEIGVTNHVSWQCPNCGVWSSEDVEHDATGPLLVRCGSRHHVDGLWIMLNW